MAGKRKRGQNISPAQSTNTQRQRASARRVNRSPVRRVNGATASPVRRVNGAPGSPARGATASPVRRGVPASPLTGRVNGSTQQAPASAQQARTSAQQAPTSAQQARTSAQQAPNPVNVIAREFFSGASGSARARGATASNQGPSASETRQVVSDRAQEVIRQMNAGALVPVANAMRKLTREEMGQGLRRLYENMSEDQRAVLVQELISMYPNSLPRDLLTTRDRQLIEQTAENAARKTRRGSLISRGIGTVQAIVQLNTLLLRTGVWAWILTIVNGYTARRAETGR